MPCEHTGPCPSTQEVEDNSTGVSHDSCCGHGHDHSHGGDGGCTHDHSHGGGGGCTHDHSHGGGGGQQQHEHSHDGVPCSGDHAYEGHDLTLSSPLVDKWSSDGASVIWVFVDGQMAAAVQVAEVRAACQLSDQIRAETAP